MPKGKASVTSKSAAEVIQVPNMLKLKVGGRGGIDMAALGVAEEVVDNVKGALARVVGARARVTAHEVGA